MSGGDIMAALFAAFVLGIVAGVALLLLVQDRKRGPR